MSMSNIRIDRSTLFQTLNLTLSRPRSLQSGVESVQFFSCQFSSLGPSTASIPSENFTLEVLTELCRELPLLKQYVRKLSLPASYNVFSNHWEELESTRHEDNDKLEFVCHI